MAASLSPGPDPGLSGPRAPLLTLVLLREQNTLPGPRAPDLPFPPSQLITLRGSILEDATPTATKHGTGRGLPLRDALEYVIPELNIHCLRLALNTPKVTEQLLKLDEQGVSGRPAWGSSPQPLLATPSVLLSFFLCKEQKPA